MPGMLDLFGLTVLDFGTTVAGDTVDAVVGFQNSGDEDLHVGDIQSSGAPFTISVHPTYPFTCVPGAGGTVTVQYHPLVAGTDGGTLTFLSDAINSPTLLPMTGKAIASGGALQVEPSAYQFPDQKTGTTSAQKLFVVTNNGDANVTLNNPVVAAAGWNVSTDPTPVTLLPGQSASIGITFSPVLAIFYYDPHGITISNNSGVNPLYVPLSGLGIPIVSAFTVDGLVERVIVGFRATNGGNVVQLVDVDVACEVSSETDKLFDYWFQEADFPIRGFEKTVYRLEVYYQDLGNFVLSAVLTNSRGGNSTQAASVVGTADGKTKRLIFDLKLTDELLNLSLIRTSGRVSVVLLIFSLQPGAEVVKGT